MTNWLNRTEEDNRQLIIFEDRLHALLKQYELLKQKNESLIQRLLQKDKEYEELENRCLQAEKKYADLKAARIISITDQESCDTKQRLTRLVREIDKCIALLNG